MLSSDYFILLLKGKDQSEIEKLVAWSTEHYEEKLKKRYPSGTLRLSVGICHIENLNENLIRYWRAQIWRVNW